ncbi:MAG TPA: hypothetical protein VEJ88_02800, partial [Dissulfurispiraceae bacterium]|nr:hypothetical protein [Dissulfurispiraceae bacterium]
LSSLRPNALITPSVTNKSLPEDNGIQKLKSDFLSFRLVTFSFLIGVGIGIGIVLLPFDPDTDSDPDPEMQ